MTSANKPGNQFVKQDDVISKSSVYPTILVFFRFRNQLRIIVAPQNPQLQFIPPSYNVAACSPMSPPKLR